MLISLNGRVRRKFPKPSFNEFVLEIDNLDSFYTSCVENGIVPGIRLEAYYPELKNCLLICVTEMNKRTDVEKMLTLL